MGCFGYTSEALADDWTEPKACLKVYPKPDKNFFSFGKKGTWGLDLECTMGVARGLPSLTLEIALQFQMYVLGHYHA